MKQEKPSIYNDIYSHEDDNLSVAQAIGMELSAEDFTKKVEDFIDEADELPSNSEAIELACERFTKKELAFMWMAEVTEPAISGELLMELLKEHSEES